ncbi:hypothetical protein BT63DRAFT_288660 [Microthyrium microscopicum]|uniref:HMG box domain-containing protein n=1 Tax=Microthyrium microscopicum TaxID=703497 RepID=A0A6A6U859_9PEZI|nr:hypothetical protein BT63DRAFT_288660 [Microthyrium microscopicum]
MEHGYHIPDSFQTQYTQVPQEGNGQYHYEQPQGYYAEETVHPYISSHLQSPPTPMSNISDETRRTRSGRPITRLDSPHGSFAPRSPSPKKRRAKGKVKANIPPLAAPLSVLTKDMQIPVRDMDAHVNRPLEERQAEAAKRKGYVTRPMNSFMLYRSAYSERTKAWCRANNHQIVSSVSGASWPLEPAEIRNFYGDLAKTERANHQIAHPTYKFTPSKPGANRKRKGSYDIDDGGITLANDNDPDGDWASSQGAAVRRIRTARESAFEGRSRPSRAAASPAPIPEHMYYPGPSGPSGYETTRSMSGTPLQQQQMYSAPGPYHQMPQLHSQMYQQPVQDPNMYNMGYDDGNSGYVSLPGGNAHELQFDNLDGLMGGHQQHSQHHHQASIDPMLMPSLNGEHNVSQPPQEQMPYANEYAPPYMNPYATDTVQSSTPLLDHQTVPDVPFDQQHDWPTEPTETPLEPSNEFTQFFSQPAPSMSASTPRRESMPVSEPVHDSVVEAKHPEEEQLPAPNNVPVSPTDGTGSRMETPVQED